MSAAKFHSVALADSGAVYTWGYGGPGGRLGHGDAVVVHRRGPARWHGPLAWPAGDTDRRLFGFIALSN